MVHSIVFKLMLDSVAGPATGDGWAILRVPETTRYGTCSDDPRSTANAGFDDLKVS